MLNQLRHANNNLSTTSDRPTDAADLSTAALTATGDRRSFIASLAGLLVGATATNTVSAQPPVAPVVAPLIQYDISGMLHSPRFYNPHGVETRPRAYTGPLEAGGALNVITTAVNNIRATHPGGRFPPGTICTLSIYTGNNRMPDATLVLPNVPERVNRDTMREFLGSIGGRLAIGALAPMRVDIPLQNNNLPGNLSFTDREVRAVRINVILPPAIPPAIPPAK